MTASDTQALLELLPDAQDISLAGGHYPMIEEAPSLAAEIAKFLQPWRP
jgi:hypothetical protein